jgi:DNA-binding transcriptional LysR family regulator
MDWDDLKIILAIGRCGSLGKAARSLGLTQPTIGRRLEAFERKIGAKLFERSNDGLMPTALGSALFESLGRMEEEALTVERHIAARDDALQGKIIVTSLDWFGDYVIAPIAAAFAAEHKLITVELLNEGRIYNLFRREADIAIRFRAFDC